ncbi:hypothetical protein [Stratiformator vulcanicus]|uniref:Uncharacterized protein n=1 Tax=Stratiformator vulcanicus TaxID=2527980 RepID=A0A517QZ84_9PLAN|nr:hypothetical protein [Stratiformator vulcanicus]QDT36850.1 hypothetical protein Pan189_12130 [Stratiformator vulcanicus]
MIRVLVAGLVGGMVYYVWLVMTWMVLPVHDDSMQQLPGEDQFRAMVVDQEVETGVYFVPFGSPEEIGDPESGFYEKHQEGPLFTLMVQRDGFEPMRPQIFVTGFALDVAASLIASALLWGAAGGCCRSYFARVGFVLGLGLFASIVSHGAMWNWMLVPTAHTLSMAFEVAVGWLLVGLVIAGIVVPPKSVVKIEDKTAEEASAQT